jgi:ferrous iron transport protein B
VIASLNIALLGNPNCGKTALFNLLTGSRQKVANYTGVTVERKEGLLTTAGGKRVRVLDLPGAYSLNPMSADEAITHAVVTGLHTGEQKPDLIVCVTDATNLKLNLRLVLEARRLGLPLVVALNMTDVARRRGIHIDSAALERELGVPVVETVAVRRDGARALLERLDALALPRSLETTPWGAPNVDDVLSAQRDVRRIFAVAVREPPAEVRVDDAIDRVVLHPFWGMVVLVATLFLMFQAVFSWAQLPMDAIKATMESLGGLVRGVLPPGMFQSLLVDGIIAGAGSVLVFLPQILILFLFILALEDSGYLPRAAFLLDRTMSTVGLSGRSFIPLLSSFACAIPGIMATRTISNWRDRLVTIMIAPLMTCSARLPVYATVIGAFVPNRTVWRVFNL